MSRSPSSSRSNSGDSVPSFRLTPPTPPGSGPGARSNAAPAYAPPPHRPRAFSSPLRPLHSAPIMPASSPAPMPRSTSASTSASGRAGQDQDRGARWGGSSIVNAVGWLLWGQNGNGSGSADGTSGGQHASYGQGYGRGGWGVDEEAGHGTAGTSTAMAFGQGDQGGSRLVQARSPAAQSQIPQAQDEIQGQIQEAPAPRPDAILPGIYPHPHPNASSALSLHGANGSLISLEATVDENGVSGLGLGGVCVGRGGEQTTFVPWESVTSFASSFADRGRESFDVRPSLDLPSARASMDSQFSADGPRDGERNTMGMTTVSGMDAVASDSDDSDSDNSGSGTRTPVHGAASLPALPPAYFTPGAGVSATDLPAYHAFNQMFAPSSVITPRCGSGGQGGISPPAACRTESPPPVYPISLPGYSAGVPLPSQGMPGAFPFVDGEDGFTTPERLVWIRRTLDEIEDEIRRAEVAKLLERDWVMDVELTRMGF